MNGYSKLVHSYYTYQHAHMYVCMYSYTLLMSSALVVGDFLPVFTVKVPAANSAKDTASLAAVSQLSHTHTHNYIEPQSCGCSGLGRWLLRFPTRSTVCLQVFWQSVGSLSPCEMCVFARLYLDPIKVNKYACTQWILERLQPHSNFELERLQQKRLDGYEIYLFFFFLFFCWK